MGSACMNLGRAYIHVLACMYMYVYVRRGVCVCECVCACGSSAMERGFEVKRERDKKGVCERTHAKE